MLHYLYYIYTILLVLLDYFLKKWLFYEVGLSSSLLKNIWGLDFKEVEIELPQLSVCADAICRRNSVLLKFELNFFLLSLSWLLQLFFSRNVSWKRIFGPTNLVQHTFYWKLLKKYAKYRSGFFEIFFINMKSYNIHQDPKHLQLCKNVTFQQLYYISVKWGFHSKFHY